jgi:hypothetical protein
MERRKARGYLHLGFDGVVRWKSPASEIFFSLPKKSKGAESGLYGGWGVVQEWRRQQDVSFYRQDLENLIVRCDKCLNKFGNCVEKQRTDVHRYPCAFLVPAYLHSRKKKQDILLSDLPSYNHFFSYGHTYYFRITIRVKRPS